MRRRTMAAGGLASVALVAGGLAWVRADDAPADDGDDPAAPEATAPVERRDLQERAELTGTLGYGDATELALGSSSSDDDTGDAPTGDSDTGSGSGTITALPAVGATVDRGQTLVEVDGRPVPLLIGQRPLWRALGADAEDGADVQQVEQNLVDLGVVATDELTVDQDWTSATTDAVEEWQESLGLEETGTLAPGDVVFRPGPVRVVSHPTPVGGSASATVLEVSSTTKIVTVDLEATDQTLVSAGQEVEVELPDGTAVGGTVFEVGTVATVPDDSESDMPDADGGTATIDVVVALDDPAQAGSYDEAPVTVRVVTSAAEGVLAVPVDALVALAEGGYAVERVTEGAGTELVGVEVGAFADGWVEVTGDLAEGDAVGVPAS